MNRSITFVAAAAMAISGFTFLPAFGADQAADNNPPANTNTDNMAVHGQAVSESEAKSIDKTLADVTESAVEKNGFSDVISYLNQNDSKRLKDDSKNANFDDLNAAVAQFQQDWNSKYNHDFKIDDAHKAYSTAMVYQGDVPSEARTAGETMGPNNTAAPQTNGDNSAANRTDKNLATVVFEATNGHHPMTIHLSNEGTITDSWKIDLPQQFTADQLKNSLVSRLNRLHANVDKWPSDEAAAQRVVTTQILTAIVHADGRTMPAGADNGNMNGAPANAPQQ